MKKQLLLLLASTLVLAGSLAAAHAQGGAAGPMMQSDQPGGGGMMHQQHAEGDEGGGPQRRQPPAGMRGMMGGPHMLTLVMIMMDTDGDGTLSLAEVQAVHARAFNYADGDDDGKLTLEEIQRFFRAAPGAIAADPAVPDLRGTWRLEADAVIRGAAPFHPAGAPPPAEGMEPRLRPFTGTLRIDGQEGARFWGVVENESASEELVGSFTGEGRRFIMADVDGEFDGELLEGGGTFRYCYRHVTPGSRVTACGTGKRE